MRYARVRSQQEWRAGMSLNAATLRLLAEKGLSAIDIVEVAEAMEVRADPTAAVRQQRRRDKLKAEKTRDESRRDVTRDAPPIDSILTPPVPQSPDGDCPPLAEKVVLAWNAGPAAKGARKAKAMDATRRRALAARVKEHGEAAVFDAIRNLAASPFHCGTNDRNWRANLGWMLDPKPFLKALEMEAPAAPAAKPADPTTFQNFCAQSAENCRKMGREQEALDWEAKARGGQPRRASTGPPRSIGNLAAGIVQQAEIAATR